MAASDSVGSGAFPPPPSDGEAAGEPVPLQPQHFERVVQLWKSFQRLYPAEEWPKDKAKEKDKKEGTNAQSSAAGESAEGEAEPENPERKAARELLTAVCGVLSTAADNCPAGDDTTPVPEPHSRVGSDSPHFAALSASRDRVRPLLEKAGWETDGEGWRLSEPHSSQLLRAAKHFAEHKLGTGSEQAQDFGHFGMGMGMGMMGMFMPPDDADLEAELKPPEGPDGPVSIDGKIDDLIKQIREERRLPDRDQIKVLCLKARELLLAEENVLTVPIPAVLVGDIHGQFFDLLFKVLDKGGDPANTRYVFLGDFVDRGEHSLLCLALILLYKVRNPANITILRGNHESRITNNMYGFHDECRTMYPSAVSKRASLGCSPDNEIWAVFNHVFDAMPLAALVGDRVFCCHGGLSPQLQTLDRMLTFDRYRDIIPPGAMADITWSDPGASVGWRLNARGSGYLFGEDITKQFCLENRLTFVARAHQCVKEGYKWEHDKRIVTIFSAPNYCWQHNKGAILMLDANLGETFEVYDEGDRPPEGVAPPPPDVPQYFEQDEGQGDGAGGGDAAAAAPKEAAA